MKKNIKNFSERIWGIFFSLNIFEGLAVLVWIASLRSDQEGTVVLGLSAGRLGLLLVILLAVLVFILFLFVRGLRSWLQEAVQAIKFPWVLYFLAGLGVITGILLPTILISIYSTSGEYIFRAIYERLLPLFLWLSLFSLQLIFVFQITIQAFEIKNLKCRFPIFKLGIGILGFILACWLLIAFSGYGLTPDLVGWGNPAVGLLEWQIWLSWGFCTGFMLLFFANEKIRSVFRDFKHLDLSIALIIYFFTLAVWLSQSVPQGYFATMGREPNFEIYPFSDGAFYGNFAQNILIGNGFKGNEIPPRPLYILFLAVLHMLAGQDYSQIIFLQTLILAVFPVILYFSGKEIHSRYAGVLIAILAVFREWTAIITTPFALNTSNSKLFFSDVPTALGISLFLLISIIWLKKHKLYPLLPLAVGGTMGLLMLVRTQSLFILPAVLGAAFFIYFPKWKSWLLACLLVCIGLTASIAPWLWRNKQITGEFVFDHPESQTRVVAQRFSPSGEENPERLPGENDAEYTERLSSIIWDYFKSDPQRILSFVGAHFINSEVDDQFILPIRANIMNFRDIIIPQTSFWQAEHTNLNLYQISILFLNLLLLSLGLAASWKKNGWIGLLPIFANLTYNFSNAMARNSGGRYLIPVDWIIVFYYAIGLIEISFALFLVFSKKPDDFFLIPTKNKYLQTEKLKVFSNRKKTMGGVILTAAFFLTGASLPLCEILIPEQFPTLAPSEFSDKFLERIDDKLNQKELDKVNELLMDENTLMEHGLAVYPRFYAAGDGEPLTAKTGYEPLNYARLTFLLVSPRNTLIILPDNEVPQYFPNASEVMILGCQQNNYVEAAIILLTNEQEIFYKNENFDNFFCDPMSK